MSVHRPEPARALRPAGWVCPGGGSSVSATLFTVRNCFLTANSHHSSGSREARFAGTRRLCRRCPPRQPRKAIRPCSRLVHTDHYRLTGSPLPFVGCRFEQNNSFQYYTKTKRAENRCWLERGFTGVARANSHGLLHGADEDFAVTNLAGLRRALDRLHGVLHAVLANHQLEF